MTDTITLPSGVEVYEGKILVIPGIGVVIPPGSLTPAEVQQLRDDVASVLGMSLDDLADVAADAPASGDALVWNGTSWTPIPLLSGLSRVEQNYGGSAGADDVTLLTFGQGLAVSNPATGRAHIVPVFGTTSTTIAAGNHPHPPTIKGEIDFDKTGAVLSTGSSPLVSHTVTGIVPNLAYDVSITGTLEAVNTNLSGRLTLKTILGGSLEKERSFGFSGGVWSQKTIIDEIMSVSAGGGNTMSLSFTAIYQSGDPTALYTGQLAYRFEPRGGQA